MVVLEFECVAAGSKQKQDTFHEGDVFLKPLPHHTPPTMIVSRTHFATFHLFIQLSLFPSSRPISLIARAPSWVLDENDLQLGRVELNL